MRILLDTSAYSAFMRGDHDTAEMVREAGEIYLSVVTLGELKAGAARGKRKKKNDSELKEFLSSPRVRVLSADMDTSECYSAILTRLWEMGTPIPTNDIWIAASAMQHGLRLVTTDHHFEKVAQIISVIL